MTSTEPSEQHIAPPRIVRIAVKELFGILDHDVELKHAERVTIVHGINGVGKTKLLELTAALTRGHFVRLTEIPFKQLRVELADGTAIEVRRDAKQSVSLASSEKPKRKLQRQRRPPATLEIRRFNIATAKELATWSIGAGDNADRRRSHYGLPDWIEPLGDGTWMDLQANEVVTSGDLSRRYGFPRAMLQRAAIPVDTLRELIPCEPAHLIETQRLLRLGGRGGPPNHDDEDDALVMTVHELAAELKQTIARVQNEFFQKTQALDRTLTDRVLRSKLDVSALGETLRVRLEALGVHRQRLEAVGLLDAGTFGPSLAPADAGALAGDRAVMISVHTDDAEQKFAVLDPLATRLEPFLLGVNEKLAQPKKLVLDRDLNLSVQRDGETIALDQLSSGEQHEIVLLYDLAFRIKPNTLVLIDEPELSLHPVWQQQFLDDIIKIAKNGSFDVLLATHSPYIVGNRSDLCIELKAESRA